MTATTQPGLPGMADEDASDGDMAVYRHLTDDHVVVNCRCGRELLAANLPGESYRGFKETEQDGLPPLVFAWRAVRGRRVAVCCACAVAERRANRGRG